MHFAIRDAFVGKASQLRDGFATFRFWLKISSFPCETADRRANGVSTNPKGRPLSSSASTLDGDLVVTGRKIVISRLILVPFVGCFLCWLYFGLSGCRLLFVAFIAKQKEFEWGIGKKEKAF